MEKFDFKKIENKWQKRWEKEKVFVAKDNSKKKKYYVLEMFPYPSADGLHMGHALNFTINDIFARFRRMQGFNVMYPIGYDSLGLPAENAAIKAGTHPKKYTDNSIKNFMKQQRELGFSYDKTRFINTADSSYYKWDQWIFLKLFEKGLAYRKKAAVNWCPSCATVLANEQAQTGNCDRCKSKVEIKHLTQWFFKTTEYADELFEGLKNMDWPEKTKTMQRNWIGKSHGVEIDFEVESKVGNVVIVHGANSDEKGAFEGGRENTRHWFPWIRKELDKKNIDFSNELYPKDWNPDYEEWKKIFEKNEINENTIIVGHSLGCGFVLRWLDENKRKVKKVILVAPYVLDSDELPGLKEMVNFEFDSSLNDLWNELIVFSSEDDSDFILNSAKQINDKLNSNHISFKDKGHFTRGDLGTEEFPEVLEEITKSEKWFIFTTRADTIFGVTFMVVSAQHEKLWDLVTSEQKKEVEKFLKKLNNVSEKDFADMEKEGVFTGSYAVNPSNGKKVPIYAGNFVLADYGSGMVMAVPAHDKRDYEFAKKYDLEIKEVVDGKRNCIIVHGSNSKDNENIKKYNLLPQNKRDWIGWIKEELEKKGIECIAPLMPKNWNPKYKDWKKEFEKIEINEKSILIGHSSGGAFLVRWLGETKRKIKKLILVAPAISNKKKENWELDEFHNFKINKNILNKVFKIILIESNDDSESIIESCKIYSRELNIKPIILKNKGHFTGKSMKTKEFPELLEKIIEVENAFTGGGNLVGSEKFNGLDNEKAKQEITKELIKKNLGRKKIQFKLRDWGISRQRYWGTPIPIVNCDKCGIVPVSEKDLPIKLPKEVKFGKGNPLETNEKWIKTKCPKCGGKARRETDTMDTFVNSSWYFMRYCDPNNEKKIFDKRKVEYWCPVDLYVGGAEHACMHLIYSRFYVKFLRDLGLINFDEPAKKLFHQGMLHASDGNKMSKSLGNVINPLDVIEKYSADSLRFALMSFAAPDKDTDWDEKVLIGSHKILNRVIEYFDNLKLGKDSEKMIVKLNKAIKDVTFFIEKMEYRKATIVIRQLWESIFEEKVSRKTLESGLKLLNLFCPHFTEELWEKLGNKDFISLSSWPNYNEGKLKIKKQEINLDEKIISYVKGIIEKVESKGEKVSKVYLYVMPFELGELDLEKIGNNLAKEVIIYSVKDKDKYDPENKSKKARSGGRPGIYFE